MQEAEIADAGQVTRRGIVGGFGLSLLGWNGIVQARSTSGVNERFGFAGPDVPEGFVLDGKPLQIRSGEMHPARIPRIYWQHRIRMAKAMGLNTIAL